MTNFSVLLSLYHKESPFCLRQSLDSIFHQSLLPTEVVLVEDGSLTNELYQIVDEYSRQYSSVKVVPLSHNIGLGKALNEGLKHCSYDIIARMDTDDVAKSNRFELQMKVFDEHPEYDVVGAWIDEFEDSTSNVISTRKLPENHDEIYKYAQKRNPINHPVVMFRKTAVEAAGGYKHFPLFEDYYLWVRMLLNGAKFYNIQESLLFFRFSQEMFKRRGGFAYAFTEAKFLWHIHQLGMMGLGRTCTNVSLRFVTRIIPNEVRSWIYKKILR